jgi:FkbM family methyltransferase
MRKLLRKLKENRFINKTVRLLLINPLCRITGLHLFLVKRWLPSGVSNCRFGPYSFKLYSKCDDGIVAALLYNLPYNEKADLALFSELSKKAKTIYDVGANTGVFSVLASKANPQAVIKAFEPNSVNAERLKINLKLNAANNVQVKEMAVGDKDGEIEISVTHNGTITDVSSVNKEFSAGVYPGVEWDSRKVKMRSLDSISLEEGLKPGLIKCDVETFEMFVFKGADRILRESKPTIIFECFLDDERKAFFDAVLSKYNYYLYLILEEGVVYSKEGFVKSTSGLNYLITPVAPARTFIRYAETEALSKELLLG